MYDIIDWEKWMGGWVNNLLVNNLLLSKGNKWLLILEFGDSIINILL